MLFLLLKWPLSLNSFYIIMSTYKVVDDFAVAKDVVRMW